MFRKTNQDPRFQNIIDAKYQGYIKSGKLNSQQAAAQKQEEMGRVQSQFGYSANLTQKLQKPTFQQVSQPISTPAVAAKPCSSCNQNKLYAQQRQILNKFQ